MSSFIDHFIASPLSRAESAADRRFVGTAEHRRRRGMRLALLEQREYSSNDDSMAQAHLRHRAQRSSQL